MKPPLTDTSFMPFGKHKGKTMSDVPADYFHYLWHNGMRHEKSPVAEYIRANLDAFQMEKPDLIW